MLKPEVYLGHRRSSSPLGYVLTYASLLCAGIVSLQEANMAFLPYESKVFTLDYPDVFEDFYSRDRVSAGHVTDRIADQLATVCAMMGEYPSVRYRK